MAYDKAVSQEHMNGLLSKIIYEYSTHLNKCTIVSGRLPNGFIITDSHTCRDQDSYDIKLGFEICRNRIEEKAWELEGYLLSQKLHEEQMEELASFKLTKR